MTPLLPVLGLAFISLAVLWPLAFFGHRFYTDTVAAEEAKHAKHGGH